jgi:hypothetical protein
MAPEVGLEPTTLRLTGGVSSSEQLCYQWSIREPMGRFGALSAHNLTKNLTKFFDEMSIRFWPETRLPTVSGYLVVDRADFEGSPNSLFGANP